MSGIRMVVYVSKKYSSIRLIGRVYSQTLKIAPVSGILSPLYYLIQGLFPAFIAVVISKLFDKVHLFVQHKESSKTLFWYGGMLVIGYLLKQIFQYISSVTINAGVYERCVSYQNMQISEKAARLPLIMYESPEIMNQQIRAKDCVNREKIGTIFMTTTVLITSGIGVISIILVLARYNIWLVPISLFSVLPYFILKIIRGKEFYYIKYHQAKKVRRRDYLWGMLTSKKSIKEMRVMGFGEYITERWIECRDDVNEEIWNQSKKDAISLLVCNLIRICGYGISIYFALCLTVKGDISVGLFGACIGALASVQEQTKNFLTELGSLPENLAYAKDYYEFMDLLEDKDGVKQIEHLNKTIEMKNVSFCYPNREKYAIKNVNLKINKGEKVSIIGENGSGKTTLSKIILGLYPSSEGDVLYDGLNVNELKKDSLYRTVSVIAQNYVSYYLKLRENVAISDIKNLNDNEKIIKTLEKVGLSEICKTEKLLDKQMGKEFNGIELSGGQWQKLSIARGIYKESEIILLDEPTSALDPLIENEILKQFLTAAIGKTAIVISHRVGLCRMMDKIVVMKNGEIVEVGNHNELFKKNGEYTRLYNAQQQWYQ